MKWYLMAWQGFADFKGRSRRAEFWTFVLANSVMIAVLSLAMIGFGVVKEPAIGASCGMIAAAFALAVVLPSLACTVRRLHDTGKTGWWSVLWFIPVAGELVLLVMLAMDGTRGSNRYGPDPKLAPLPTSIG